MALTKVTGQVIKNTTDVTVGVLTVTNTLAVGGTVSIGGTLTYEDVTNVDAVGLITARNGIVVGSGITLSKDGDVFFTGIATGNGSGLTAINASNIGSGTVPTARLGSGTASSSTFLRGDSTFQTVVTDLVNDTSPQLGGDLASNGSDILFADNDKAIFGTGSDFKIYHNGTDNYLMASNGHIRFDTGSAELARITSDGKLLVGTTTEGSSSADDLTIATTGTTGMTIRSGTSGAGNIEFSDGTSGTDEYRGIVQYHHSGDSMRFFTNAAERLRITSDGDIFQGTTSSTARFAIQGSSSSTSATSADTNGVSLILSNTDTTNNNWQGVEFSDRTDSADFITAMISQCTNHSSNYGDLTFWTNSAGGRTEKLRIYSDGALSTSVGTQLSHKSGGDKLVYADMQQYTINDSDNGYKTMKLWKADKSGSFTLEVSMHNSPGTYYWSYIVYNVTQSIRVNQAGTGGDSNNLKFNEGLASGESANVHDYRRFSITCGATEGSVKVGDQLELRMASTDINGNIVTGNGQTQYANGLKIFSTTGNPGTGAIDGHGYNAAMNTRNCCYWWLDRNGNYNGFNSQSESTAIPFNRLVESANFGSAEHYNGVVTIKQDGVYALNASAYSTTGSVAFTQGWWIVGGSRHTGCDIVLGSSSSIMSMSGFMYLTAGQTVGFHPHYSGSNSIQITDSSYHTYFRGCLINATNATRNSYV